LARSVDVVFGVVEEFDPVSDPANDSRDGEKNGVHVSREAHSSVDEATVEIDVRVELSTDEVLIRKSDLFEFKSDLDQWLLAADIKDVKSDLNLRLCTFLTILARGS
jgi:hypothetical protein